MRPAWRQLERPGRAADVWANAGPRFSSQVLGPHFEELCREWVRRFAAPETLGGQIVDVEQGVAHDARERRGLQVDVVAWGGEGRVLCLGEAKWGEVMGVAHLERLHRARDLLSSRFDSSGIRLACFSAAGFTPELRDL